MTVPSRAQLRKFGLVVGGVFVLLAGVSAWRGHDLLPRALGALGGTLVLGGALAPGLLAPVERAWMALAHVLGRINTALILGLLYFLVFTPVGWLRRMLADPLDRRMGQDRSSHWVPREARGADIDRYRHQF